MYIMNVVFYSHSGESRSTTISRAILAAIIVLAMSIFSSYNIIIEPMRETASPPVNEVRSFSIPQDVLDYMFRDFENERTSLTGGDAVSRIGSMMIL